MSERNERRSKNSGQNAINNAGILSLPEEENSSLKNAYKYKNMPLFK